MGTLVYYLINTVLFSTTAFFSAGTRPRRKILIAGADEEKCLQLSEIVRRAGYGNRIIAVVYTREGIERSIKLEPDVIVASFFLRHGDVFGPELAKKTGARIIVVLFAREIALATQEILKEVGTFKNVQILKKYDELGIENTIKIAMGRVPPFTALQFPRRR